MMEVKNGTIEASAHPSTVYGAGHSEKINQQDEYCVFEELRQVESSYSLTNLSMVHPLIVALMAGEERCDNGQISIANDWIKMQARNNDADICKMRRALKYCFACFCENPHQPPSDDQMWFLDKAFDLISAVSEEMTQSTRSNGYGGGNRDRAYSGGKGGYYGGGKGQKQQQQQARRMDDGPEEGTNEWFKLQNQTLKRDRFEGDVDDMDAAFEELDGEPESKRQRQDDGGEEGGEYYEEGGDEEGGEEAEAWEDDNQATSSRGSYYDNNRVGDNNNFRS